jgi:hypothetical protein
MLFLTIVFIALYLILLVRGNGYSELIIKVGENELKNAETGSNNKVDESTAYNVAGVGCFLWCLFFMEIIYFIVALQNYDVYKYPTIACILYAILGFALRKRNNKKDLTTEEGRSKFRKQLYQKNRRYTFKGIITRLLYLAYFCYMFYYLVF